jgi:hypothetical protein
MDANQLTEQIHLFDRLVAISWEAIDTTCYEAAYYTLSAAYHCARDMEDADRLTEVMKVATEQLDHIDTNAPDSIMASQAIKERHGINMYQNLRNIARIHAHWLQYPRGVDFPERDRVIETVSGK